MRLHRDVKLIRDDVEGVKTSIHRAWEAIDENKSNFSSNDNRMAEPSATYETLKDQVNAEKQHNLKLEQYTRRDDIMLLFVEEEDEENMSHGNGCTQSRHEILGGSYGSKPDKPRHIIARFISRKDSDLVWSQQIR